VQRRPFIQRLQINLQWHFRLPGEYLMQLFKVTGLHRIPHLILNMLDLSPITRPYGPIQLPIPLDAGIGHIIRLIAVEHGGVIIEVLDDNGELFLLLLVVHNLYKLRSGEQLSNAADLPADFVEVAGEQALVALQHFAVVLQLRF
jgi:hypothetical protein